MKMKKIGVLAIVLLILCVGLASASTVHVAKQAEIKKNQSSQVFHLTIGDIKDAFSTAAQQIESPHTKSMVMQRIENAFDEAYAQGITDDMTLEELLTTDASSLLDTFHINFICNVDVEMQVGLVVSIEDILDVNVSGRLLVGRGSMMSHFAPDAAIEELLGDFPLIAWLYDLVKSVVGLDALFEQYSVDTIRLILDIDTEIVDDGHESITDPDLDLPFPIIEEALESLLKLLGLKSYSLRARALLIIGL